jgi:hypothetical protein
MKHEIICSIIALVIIFVSGFVSYNILEDKRITSLEKSIETAAARGIDPVAVRCAYAGTNDTICIVYANKK